MHMHNKPHWLVPFDGSAQSTKALALAVREIKDRLSPPELMVLNVQLPLSTDITRFIDSKTLDGFHKKAGEEALATAKAELEQAGVVHSIHIQVGSVAKTIVEFADSHNCSLIVMGTHGHSSVAGLLMGSVTTKVLHQSGIPVLLTK
jgi:nucleotide-binding universal stress UspA family protein